MANKYLSYNTDGNQQEVEGLVTSAGAGDAGKIPALDGAGKLSSTVMPTGIGADTTSIPASENLAAGDLVNLWNDAGTLKVRKADASDAGKPADGFVLSAVTAPASALVYFEGENDQVTGLTPAATLFLSNSTPGGTQETPVTTAGHISQRVGRAKGATAFDFEKGTPVVRA